MRMLNRVMRSGLVAALALCFVSEATAQRSNYSSAYDQGFESQLEHELEDELRYQLGNDWDFPELETDFVQYETRMINVQLRGAQTFMPPRTYGDDEFGGHGPVMNFRTEVYCDDNRRIYRRIFVSAYENILTGGGRFDPVPSGAKGWSPPQLVYTAPAGWTIKTFRRRDNRFPEHYDTNYNAFSVPTPAGLLTFFGDRRGDDIGVYTRCELVWNDGVIAEIKRPLDILNR